MKFPESKEFAFSIIDDTDNATVENVKPVYDFLIKKGIKTTKTVWVYPPRDNFFNSETLQDRLYLDFLKEIKENGIELTLHSVGSGEFSRKEILQGIDVFEKEFGVIPKIHVNHSQNPDNLYWNPSSRFVFPFDKILNLVNTLKGKNSNQFNGENPSSKFFWGDIAKEKVKYFRNFTFNGINTMKFDSKMPYINPYKKKYSNYWFSSSDGHTVNQFNELISKKNIDYLQKVNGVCIVYTHFAEGFMSNGKLDSTFEDRITYLSEQNGWFVPASELLDYLLLNNSASSEEVRYRYLLKISFLWFFQRMVKYLKYKF